MTEASESIRDRIAKLKQDQVDHLAMVIEVHEMMDHVRSTYDKVLLAAHELGVSNTAIAKGIGKSETSVRLYIKRRIEGVPHR